MTMNQTDCRDTPLIQKCSPQTALDLDLIINTGTGCPQLRALEPPHCQHNYLADLLIFLQMSWGNSLSQVICTKAAPQAAVKFCLILSAPWFLTTYQSTQTKQNLLLFTEIDVTVFYGSVAFYHTQMCRFKGHHGNSFGLQYCFMPLQLLVLSHFLPKEQHLKWIDAFLYWTDYPYYVQTSSYHVTDSCSVQDAQPAYVLRFLL